MYTFNQEMQKLLKSNQPMTIQTLIDVFGEKSFGVLFIVLLAIPALPLPTGGITHIFELIAMLLSVELMSGRKTVWLPKRWLNRSLPAGLRGPGLPRFIKIIRSVERFSRPRLRAIQTSSLYTKVVGVVLLLFTLFAFLAPPFSGLDTLPSLGVVLLSLGLLFEDSLLSVIGFITGSIGILLIFLLGRLAFQLL